MSDAPFDDGEVIFEQGDDGDAFYVVLSGSAVVERIEEGADHVTVLAELREGAYFGERALLKNDVRFGTVKATSKLRTMSITRQKFEASFGPLQGLLDDANYGN
uniref:Cyclic nucleotide-binding domain-containing protein n=1 Tax=Haptolina brevifila TaxID=156173 RepID=A0A7S2CVG8_9EUKA